MVVDIDKNSRGVAGGQTDADWETGQPCSSAAHGGLCSTGHTSIDTVWTPVGDPIKKKVPVCDLNIGSMGFVSF